MPFKGSHGSLAGGAGPRRGGAGPAAGAAERVQGGGQVEGGAVSLGGWLVVLWWYYGRKKITNSLVSILMVYYIDTNGIYGIVSKSIAIVYDNL